MARMMINTVMRTRMMMMMMSSRICRVVMRNQRFLSLQKNKSAVR